MKNDEKEILACILYSEYCEKVGGKAFNGEPLPGWSEFRADENKIKQVNAWLAVAEKALSFTGAKIIV